MKSSVFLRIIFWVLLSIFVLNFSILLIYFPLQSSTAAAPSPVTGHVSSALPLRRKNHGNIEKPEDTQLRKKHRRKQQRDRSSVHDEGKQQEQELQDRKGRAYKSKTTPAIKRAGNMAKSSKCPDFGCPVYPPELTNPHINQNIREVLESSGYVPSSQLSNAEHPPFENELPFEFASDSFVTLSQQGKSHEINQDRAVFVSPFLPDLLSSSTPPTRSFLSCIFDGHGQLGHRVAQEVVEKFPLVLGSKLSIALGSDVKHSTFNDKEGSRTSINSNNSTNGTNQTILVKAQDYDATDLAIRKALNETFLEVNEKGTASVFLLGGCTASVTLRWGSKLYVANAGDSQTIVVSASLPSNKNNPEWRQQHHDQNGKTASVQYETRRDKANQPGERARIEKLGGRIHVGAGGFDPRVVVHSKAANDMIGLAMSRSIGDWEWKPVGVIAEPTIDVIDLAMLSNVNRTAFLIAASDGFWDMRQKHFYSNQLALSFTTGTETKQNQGDNDDSNARFKPLYYLYDTIQRITPKLQTGYRDDITATIVNLGW